MKRKILTIAALFWAVFAFAQDPNAPYPAVGVGNAPFNSRAMITKQYQGQNGKPVWITFEAFADSIATYITTDSTDTPLYNPNDTASITVYAPNHGLNVNDYTGGIIPFRPGFLPAKATVQDSLQIGYIIATPDPDTLVYKYSGELAIDTDTLKQFGTYYLSDTPGMSDTIPGTIESQTFVMVDSGLVYLREIGFRTDFYIPVYSIPAVFFTVFGGDASAPSDSFITVVANFLYNAGAIRAGSYLVTETSAASDNPTYINSGIPSNMWVFTSPAETPRRIRGQINSISLTDTIWGGSGLEPLDTVIHTGVPTVSQVADWYETNFTNNDLRLENGSLLYYIGSGDKQNPETVFWIGQELTESGIPDNNYERLIKKLPGGSSGGDWLGTYLPAGDVTINTSNLFALTDGTNDIWIYPNDFSMYSPTSAINFYPNYLGMENGSNIGYFNTTELEFSDWTYAQMGNFYLNTNQDTTGTLGYALVRTGSEIELSPVSTTWLKPAWEGGNVTINYLNNRLLWNSSTGTYYDFSPDYMELYFDDGTGNNGGSIYNYNGSGTGMYSFDIDDTGTFDLRPEILSLRTGLGSGAWMGMFFQKTAGGAVVSDSSMVFTRRRSPDPDFRFTTMNASVDSMYFANESYAIPSSGPVSDSSFIMFNSLGNSEWVLNNDIGTWMKPEIENNGGFTINSNNSYNFRNAAGTENTYYDASLIQMNAIPQAGNDLMQLTRNSIVFDDGTEVSTLNKSSLSIDDGTNTTVLTQGSLDSDGNLYTGRNTIGAGQKAYSLFRDNGLLSYAESATGAYSGLALNPSATASGYNLDASDNTGNYYSYISVDASANAANNQIYILSEDYSGSNQNMGVYFEKSSGVVFGAGGNNDYIFKGGNIYGSNDLFTIKSTGQLQGNLYGSGTFTGTAAYYMAVDASGNLIEVSAPTSTNFYNTNGSFTGNRTAAMGVNDVYFTTSGGTLYITDGAFSNQSNWTTTGYYHNYTDGVSDFSTMVGGMSSGDPYWQHSASDADQNTIIQNTVDPSEGEMGFSIATEPDDTDASLNVNLTIGEFFTGTGVGTGLNLFNQDFGSKTWAGKYRFMSYETTTNTFSLFDNGLIFDDGAVPSTTSSTVSLMKWTGDGTDANPGTVTLSSFAANAILKTDGTNFVGSSVMSETGTAITFTAPLYEGDGSATAPTYSNTGDTNTGAYFHADNNYSFATDGTFRGAFDENGFFGVGVTDPTSYLHSSGTGSIQLRLENSFTPTGTSDAAGATGNIAWDDDYIYVKTSAGWKRSALSTF